MSVYGALQVPLRTEPPHSGALPPWPSPEALEQLRAVAELEDLAVGLRARYRLPPVLIHRCKLLALRRQLSVDARPPEPPCHRGEEQEHINRPSSRRETTPKSKGNRKDWVSGWKKMNKKALDPLRPLGPTLSHGMGRNIRSSPKAYRCPTCCPFLLSNNEAQRTHDGRPLEDWKSPGG